MKFFETNLSNNMDLFLLTFYQHLLVWPACLKKKEKELTDIDMLQVVEERIRGGICHAIHRYAKANNKYMKDYNQNKESSYIMY